MAYVYGHYNKGSGGKTRPLYGADHPNWKGGKASYRTRALREKGAVCELCGYDKYHELLWVHHKDLVPRHRQTNHSIENLEVLCIRCHMEKHLETNTGWYKPDRRDFFVHWREAQVG